MQITEIRWKIDHLSREGRGSRLPVGSGITVLDGRSEEGPPLDCSRLQSLFVNPARDLKDEFWEFLFEDRGQTIVLSSDRSQPGRESFFRRSSVGRESELLGDHLESILLPEKNLSPEKAAVRLSEVLDRMAEVQQGLMDHSGKRGRIPALETELEEVGGEISDLSGDMAAPNHLQTQITDKEEELRRLRSQDMQLGKEQRQLKYLRTKSEYENLLALRDSLKETEERAGTFGARITDPGHNITVHELTELTRLRNEAKEYAREAHQHSLELDKVRERRMKTEQERILLSHEINRLEAETRSQAEDLFIPRERIQARPQKEESFPTKKQLAWLLVALLAALAILAFMLSPAAGYVMGASALILAGLQIYPLIFRSVQDREEEDMYPEDPSPVYESTDSSFAALQGELDRLSMEARELEHKEDRMAAEEAVVSRKSRRKENELLLYIRQYAGPSEISEVDDILAALSRQRDSDSLYNETVSDLLRQIADIKHGRSDEEMLREYDEACERLYGEEGEAALSSYSTRTLFYDPDRARDVSRERLELAARIDQLKEEVRSGKNQWSRSREAAVAFGSLDQKRSVLSSALKEARADYAKRAAAIGWLAELLDLWQDIDPALWAETAAGFLARLTGRRTALLPLTGDRPALRTPSIEGGVPAPGRPAGLDREAFLSAAPAFRYLAWRLALASLDGIGLPVLFFDPYLPAGRADRDKLLNMLEEWVLETGRQVIYLTLDGDLLETARERQVKVYNLF